MNMVEPFTDAELQTLAAKESRARQHMENQSSTQSVSSRSSQVSESNNPAANDAKYRGEFHAAKYSMTEAEYVSMRRVDDGLEVLQPATVAALNPMASGI